MSFDKDIILGNVGEELTLKLLKQDKTITKIKDVRTERKFQKWDIDFIIYKNDRKIKLEVKTDRLAFETGNIIYEKYSNIKYNSIGCFEKTRANYILYYILHTNVLYIINVLEFNFWVNSHKPNELEVIRMGDNAIGYLFSLEELEEHSFIEKVYLRERLI
jgi:hypothetical protein